jgi:hypothetical protein
MIVAVAVVVVGAIVAVYRDVSTSTLFEAAETTQEDSVTTVATIPALTPTVTNGRVLAFVVNDAGTLANTTPSGWTSRQTSSSGGAHGPVRVGHVDHGNGRHVVSVGDRWERREDRVCVRHPGRRRTTTTDNQIRLGDCRMTADFAG